MFFSSLCLAERRCYWTIFFYDFDKARLGENSKNRIG